MKTSSRWADLRPRVISAVVMVALAALAIGSGGLVFTLSIALICAGILWELAAMLWPGQGMRALRFAVVGGSAVFAASFLPLLLALPILLLPAVLAYLEDKKVGIRFAPFAIWVMVAGFGFIGLRNNLGLDWLLWLVSVVVACDVAGYFAGKTIGGRKFWPRISPKKTWSGTSAGWVAAACVGIAFTGTLGFGFGGVVFSVLVAMASQAGDIAESAMKRRCQVKDSSAMIPGHGGLFDRFDGMLGASALFMVFLALHSL
ncbi:phosphatidate cytidylyltransferase [Epibacterium sp. SM1969]|uniref:Phosphatidate cytidylyltransferase n=1 Tax=Tritonibacter aquimaris TaxID=2663379 RepID=A0A844ATI7_9RHOB|nr:phosphatidate cytidylyltransferase [Tritonibacter aquimaris]MQY41341.1 phosphatidate cytidylyltransferase [Tritonibacter aquimaris]